MRTGRFAAGAIYAIALAGCADDSVTSAVHAPAPPPRLDLVTVAANPNNVLSAMVTIAAHDADSVVVRFLRAGAPAFESVAAAVVGTDGSASVPVLGLFAASDYQFAVLAYGIGGITISDRVAFTTGALPVDLPSYVASGQDPSPGFVTVAVGAASKYVMVIDNTGRVVWYRYFPDGTGLNFMAQPTGHYVLRPPTPAAGDIEPWVELDPLGNITRTLSCASGLQPRPHDLVLVSDGSFWILCDETRTMDLTALGGVAAARVTGTDIQHIGPLGELLFQWSPFDHFEITDLPAADRAGVNVNWTHGNAIDFDPDGNLIASFRSLGEITSIDVHTGGVLWRLGGLRNEFTFIGTALPAFSRQHGVRMRERGVITLLDNLGNPAESRAERYFLDVATRTARLEQSHGSIPGVTTDIGGSVQPLDGGRALVSFGTAGRVEEYDAADHLLWHIEGNAGYIFRAQRIRSLYQPGVGDPR